MMATEFSGVDVAQGLFLEKLSLQKNMWTRGTVSALGEGQCFAGWLEMLVLVLSAAQPPLF